MDVRISTPQLAPVILDVMAATASRGFTFRGFVQSGRSVIAVATSGDARMEALGLTEFDAARKLERLARAN